MSRLWIVWAGLFFPLLADACAHERYTCEKQIRTLVSYRAEAIVNAFGDPLGIFPDEMELQFVDTRSPVFARTAGAIAYDPDQRQILIPRRYIGATLPNPLRWARSYWPYYENEEYKHAFPIIEAIDITFWGIYLQEAARRRGLSWPHEGCTSVDVAKRLPCEMLVDGVSEHIRTLRIPLFNSNRLDRIWPEDFEAFTKRVWRTDPEYADVQHYGGILLVQPLVSEFGLPRALAYIAGTPFEVTDDNLRTSALRYQEKAREELQPRLTKNDTAAPQPIVTLEASPGSRD